MFSPSFAKIWEVVSFFVLIWPGITHIYTGSAYALHQECIRESTQQHTQSIALHCARVASQVQGVVHVHQECIHVHVLVELVTTAHAHNNFNIM